MTRVQHVSNDREKGGCIKEVHTSYLNGSMPSPRVPRHCPTPDPECVWRTILQVEKEMDSLLSHALFRWPNICVGHSMTNCLSHTAHVCVPLFRRNRTTQRPLLECFNRAARQSRANVSQNGGQQQTHPCINAISSPSHHSLCPVLYFWVPCMENQTKAPSLYFSLSPLLFISADYISLAQSSSSSQQTRDKKIKTKVACCLNLVSNFPSPFFLLLFLCTRTAKTPFLRWNIHQLLGWILPS